MPAIPRPISLVAERAVRFLREHAEPVNSLQLAQEVLSTKISDEPTATKVLDSAFSGDPRLAYGDGGWRRTESRPAGERRGEDPNVAVDLAVDDPDYVILTVDGQRPAKGRPFALRHVTAIRLHQGDVASACGGDVSTDAEGRRLRAVLLETLEGAIPVLHDPPGSLSALEHWLEEPLDCPVSLRRLGQARLNLPANHEVETLLATLDLSWRESDDPLELADALDACLSALRKPGESLHDLRVIPEWNPKPLDWSRFAFDRNFLREIPEGAGIYRFFDAENKLLYVGKSNNLHRRIGSYFRQATRRSARVQKLLDQLYRIEVEAVGSGLEAMLREAEQIRKTKPELNTQLQIRTRTTHGSKLGSILILEPAAAPLVLRAYLLKNGRLVGKVGIGPRGGGLAKIKRSLEDNFFSVSTGPGLPGGPDVDVEVVARWLAANRDRVVAFDPTDLMSADEVVDRLRWFLRQGSPFDPDGIPIITR